MISVAAVVRATGRNWEEWESRIAGAEQGVWSHREIAAWLKTECGLDAWWAQTIAVDYEQRRGRREVGQAAATGYQIGVRKTFPLSPAALWRLLVSPEGIKAWLGETAGFTPEPGGVYTTAEGVSGEIRVFKTGSHLRLTWRPPGWERASTLQVRVVPTEAGKAVLSFHQEHLPGREAREKMRRHWQTAADGLLELV